MNKEETTFVLAIIKAAYPNSFKNMTDADARATVNVWQMNFSDVPADIVLIAVYKTISVSEFPPTVAAIRNKFRSIYIESNIELNNSCGGTQAAAKYGRICRILQPYYSARNCPEMRLTDILSNLSIEHGAGQIRATSGENDALPKGEGGSK
jgi:hypothetical protein